MQRGLDGPIALIKTMLGATSARHPGTITRIAVVTTKDSTAETTMRTTREVPAEDVRRVAVVVAAKTANKIAAESVAATKVEIDHMLQTMTGAIADATTTLLQQIHARIRPSALKPQHTSMEDRKIVRKQIADTGQKRLLLIELHRIDGAR